MNNIYLIGFMGVGKTAVSKTLRKKLGWKLMDTDELIEKKEKMTIPEIFEKKGEDYFRQVEREVVASLTKQSKVIVSCGGGVATFESNQKEIKKGGRVFFLSATPETILERVKRNNRRPLLEGKKTVKDIQKFLNERVPFYEKACDYTIVVDGKSLDSIADEILSYIDL
ncbi:MAG: shikimate kinase [Lachnospiraceae bacterium]|nr:shikimate kinase [Lachnospiraceae bacterium]